MQYILIICKVPRRRQNLPGLCMTSWATANCPEYRVAAVKMMAKRGTASFQVISRVEKTMRNLMCSAQERIMDMQSVILKKASSFYNFFRSQGVGFRQSRLKISSRRGKTAQTMTMRMKAILEQELQVEKRLTALSRERVQQGRELMMSEFLPNMSSFFLGRHCSSWAIMNRIQTKQVIINQSKLTDLNIQQNNYLSSGRLRQNKIRMKCLSTVAEDGRMGGWEAGCSGAGG